jgi:molybdopterin-guanine dinucleotide biosynthesis protein A
MSDRSAGSGADLRGRSTFVLLSGGESSRMGRDKAFLPVEGREMLDRLLEVGRSVCSGCVVVADDLPTYAGALVRYGWEASAPTGDGPRRFRRAGTPLRLATDRHPGLGPVAGLEVGLDLAPGPLCFVAACDLPFLEPVVVRALLRELDAFRSEGQAGGRPDARAVVPVVEGRRQTLAAAYTAAAAPAARRCVEDGELRVADLLARLEVRTVFADDVVPAGTGGSWRRPFTNVNRPEDLQDARRRGRGGGP